MDSRERLVCFLEQRKQRMDEGQCIETEARAQTESLSLSLSLSPLPRLSLLAYPEGWQPLPLSSLGMEMNSWKRVQFQESSLLSASSQW